MKQIKKILAMVMAVVMVIGAVNLPAKEVEAAGETDFSITGLYGAGMVQQDNRWIISYKTSVNFGNAAFGATEANLQKSYAVEVNDGTATTSYDVWWWTMGADNTLCFYIEYDKLPKTPTGYTVTIPAGLVIGYGGINYILPQDTVITYTNSGWELGFDAVSTYPSGMVQQTNRWIISMNTSVSFGNAAFGATEANLQKSYAVQVNNGTTTTSYDVWWWTMGADNTLCFYIEYEKLPQTPTGYTITIPKGLSITKNGTRYVLSRDVVLQYVSGKGWVQGFDIIRLNQSLTEYVSGKRWKFAFDTTANFGNGAFGTYTNTQYAVEFDNGTTTTSYPVYWHQIGRSYAVSFFIDNTIPETPTGYTMTVKAGLPFTYNGRHFFLNQDVTYVYHEGAWVLPSEVEPDIPSLTVEQGDILLENPDNASSVKAEIHEKLHKGTKVSFNVELNQARPFAVWLLGENSWSYEYFAHGYGEVTDTGTITVTVPQDHDYYSILVQYRDANGKADTTTDKTQMQAAIRNLTVQNGNATIRRDGKVTLTDPNEQARLEYVYDIPVPTNGKVTFDVDVTGKAPAYAVWIYEVDGGEYHAEQVTNDGNTHSVTNNKVFSQSVKNIRVLVEFRNADGSRYANADLADCTATISNLKVTSGMGVQYAREGGFIELLNTNGGVTQSFRVYEGMKKGSKINFDLDFNLNEAVAVWVLANGEWNDTANGITDNEMFVHGYSAWDGKTHYSVTATKDLTSYAICIQYRGTNKAATTNVATITNLGIEHVDATVNVEQQISMVHEATKYNETTKEWDIYLWIANALTDFNTDSYYDSIHMSVGGREKTVRAFTVKSEDDTTSKLIRFHLDASDFPGDILGNTEVKIFKDKALGYIHNGNTEHSAYQANGYSIEIVEESTLYLNELGASLGGYVTRTTANVSPTVTSSTDTQIGLAFTADTPVGSVLLAEGTEDGIYLNGNKLNNATITCTATGAYTLNLGQNAVNGDKVVLQGVLATANGNYKVSFLTTQFNYSNGTWVVTEYVPLGATGIDGDANANSKFNVADYVRYIKRMKDSTEEFNETDGDLNGDGKITEQDKKLCRAMLIETVTFVDGSNITPGAPTYTDDVELSIGAYYGPRRPGGIYYGGELVTNKGTTQTDYRNAQEFADYAAAGFNFVIAENDANYGMNWTAAGSSSAVNFSGSDLDKYMDLANDAGVDVIVNYSDMNGWLRSTNAITDTERTKITTMLGYLQTKENFKGVLMADEPYPSYYDNYATVSALIRDKAPDAEMFSSLFPHYSSEFGALGNTNWTTYKNYLSDYGNLFGSLNYDFYPFKSNSMRTTWFRNLEAAAKTGQGKYDTGVTIQSMAHESDNLLATEYREVNEADIGFQAYSALAYGNKTLTYYTYWEHYNQSDSEQYIQSMVEYPTSEGQASVKTDLYYEVQTVNNHIKAFDHVLMDYAWQGTTTINKNNSGLFSNLSSYESDRIASYSANNDAIIGHLQDSNGYDGFMLVNACDPKDNQTSKVTLQFNNATNVIYYSDGVPYDEALDGNNSYTFTLGNGKGIFVIPYVAE